MVAGLFLVLKSRHPICKLAIMAFFPLLLLLCPLFEGFCDSCLLLARKLFLASLLTSDTTLLAQLDLVLHPFDDILEFLIGFILDTFDLGLALPFKFFKLLGFLSLVDYAFFVLLSDEFLDLVGEQLVDCGHRSAQVVWQHHLLENRAVAGLASRLALCRGRLCHCDLLLLLLLLDLFLDDSFLFLLDLQRLFIEVISAVVVIARVLLLELLRIKVKVVNLASWALARLPRSREGRLETFFGNVKQIAVLLEVHA